MPVGVRRVARQARLARGASEAGSAHATQRRFLLDALSSAAAKRAGPLAVGHARAVPYAVVLAGAIVATLALIAEVTLLAVVAGPPLRASADEPARVVRAGAVARAVLPRRLAPGAAVAGNRVVLVARRARRAILAPEPERAGADRFAQGIVASTPLLALQRRRRTGRRALPRSHRVVIPRRTDHSSPPPCPPGSRSAERLCRPGTPREDCIAVLTGRSPLHTCRRPRGPGTLPRIARTARRSSTSATRRLRSEPFCGAMSSWDNSTTTCGDR